MVRVEQTMSVRAGDLVLPEGLLKVKDIFELEKLAEDDAYFVEFFSSLKLDSVSADIMYNN